MFFVELVPYLPSYGGYVRYLVGIVVTVLVGRQAIIFLNRHLEMRKLAEQMSDVQHREKLSCDTALTRLAKNVYPGCERSVDLKNLTSTVARIAGLACLTTAGLVTRAKADSPSSAVPVGLREDR